MNEFEPLGANYESRSLTANAYIQTSIDFGSVMRGLENMEQRLTRIERYLLELSQHLCRQAEGADTAKLVEDANDRS